MVKKIASAESFDEGSSPPVQSGKEFTHELWESRRDSGIRPLNGSDLGGSDEDRAEFLAGGRLLGYGEDLRRKLQPQQLRLHDTLAVGHRRNAVLMARRSAKTTTLYIEGIGRAQSPARQDYRVGVYTATTGKAGRSRFMKDVVPAIERFNDGRCTVRRGMGNEGLVWNDTGNGVYWLSSDADIRGEAFDLLIIDESGEPDVDKSADVLDAARPTLDTNPDAQLVIAGTAGRYRKGNLLWEALERARGGGGGILEYAMPDFTTVDDVATWELARPLILAAHPGIGTLTTEEIIRENYEDFQRTGRLDSFLREYGSVFGDEGGSTSLIRPGTWEPLGLDEDFPEPPPHFGLAVAMTPGQTVAAIVAAWREDGKARVLVLEHRPGVSWLAERAHELAMKYKVPIVHDSFGPILVEVETLSRMVPRPRLAPQTTRDATTAAALLVKDIETGRLQHWNQPSLTSAVTTMVRRKIGVNAWGLGRPTLEADIVAAEAAALALRWYDANPRRERLRILSA